MNIKFLGTGGAFEPHKGNSSAIFEHDGKKILIDCGYAIFERLLAKNLAQEIDYILITHLHGDHVGSIPTFLAYCEYVLGKKIPIIYATETHREQINDFLSVTWANQHAEYVPISQFPWIGFIDTFGQHVEHKQTFSYFFSNDSELFFYSGDLNRIETITEFIEKRTEKNIKIFVDISSRENPVHIYYKDAQEKLSQYETYGYHCDKATMPPDCEIPLVENCPEFMY